MSNIVSLDFKRTQQSDRRRTQQSDRRRVQQAEHCTGEAKCRDCGAAWTAVTPIGTTWMECPKCTHLTGRLTHPIRRSGGHLACQCGNDLFHLTEEGPYCNKCGIWGDVS